MKIVTLQGLLWNVELWSFNSKKSNEAIALPVNDLPGADRRDADLACNDHQHTCQCVCLSVCVCVDPQSTKRHSVGLNDGGAGHLVTASIV